MGPRSCSTRGDAALIADVRRGDVGAFVDLTGRHETAMRRLARVLDPQRLAGDLAGDALMVACTSIVEGFGPGVAMRPYLLSLVRHLHRFRSAGLVDPVLGDDTVFAVRPFTDFALHPGPGRALVETFAALPEAWQVTLWHLDVERDSPTRVGRLLGVDPGAVLPLADQVWTALSGLLPEGSGTLAEVLAEHLLGDAATEYLTLAGASLGVPGQSRRGTRAGAVRTPVAQRRGLS